MASVLLYSSALDPGICVACVSLCVPIGIYPEAKLSLECREYFHNMSVGWVAHSLCFAVTAMTLLSPRALCALQPRIVEPLYD